jgi:hypothetical protein
MRNFLVLRAKLISSEIGSANSSLQNRPIYFVCTYIILLYIIYLHYIYNIILYITFRKIVIFLMFVAILARTGRALKPIVDKKKLLISQDSHEKFVRCMRISNALRKNSIHFDEFLTRISRENMRDLQESQIGIHIAHV